MRLRVFSSVLMPSAGHASVPRHSSVRCVVVAAVRQKHKNKKKGLVCSGGLLSLAGAWRLRILWRLGLRRWGGKSWPHRRTPTEAHREDAPQGHILRRGRPPEPLPQRRRHHRAAFGDRPGIGHECLDRRDTHCDRFPLTGCVLPSLIGKLWEPEGGQH